MKKLKYIITLIILLIIILIISLVLIKNKKPKEEVITEAEPQQIVTDKLTKNISEENIFKVTNTVGTYLDILNKNNSTYFGRDENGNQIKTLEENKIKQLIYNLLAKDYIEENQVTVENVYDYVPNLEEKVLFVPLEMEVKTKGNIQKYLVKGVVENTEYKSLGNIYISVNIDTQNNTFSIEPTDNNSEELEEIEKEIKIENIEKNESNTISELVVNDQYICTQYLYFYKRLSLAQPETAYELLNKEYREKRYENVDNFKLYVDKFKEEIQALTLSKFLINEERNQFVCQDKNENYYIFDIKDNLLDYSYKLDTYTIPSQQNVEQYQNATNEQKVSLNTEKFVNMLNTRDYHTIYKLLDEEYKANYFSTEEWFIDYLKMYLPKHYNYSAEIVDTQGDLYIQDLQLFNKENSEELPYETTLIMQLKEGEDFKISLTYHDND